MHSTSKLFASQHDLLGVLLDELADRVAARIGAVRERETYTSTDLPPRTSRRRFAEICRSGRVVGATRDGSIWTVTRAAWEASRRRAPKRTPDPARDPAPPSNLEQEAAELLRGAGLRVAR